MPGFKYQTQKFTALLKVKELWEVAVCRTEHGNFQISQQKTYSTAKSGMLGSHHVKTRCNLSLLVDVLKQAFLPISGQACEHRVPCFGSCFRL